MMPPGPREVEPPPAEEQRGWRRLAAIARREMLVLRVAMALIGRVLVGIPLHADPAWVALAADIGLVAALLTALMPWGWAGGPAAVTAMAAIVESAASKLSLTAMAGEGVLLLCYLLLLDAPARLSRSDAGPWLRRLTPRALAGLIAAGVLLAALSVSPAASPWIALAGLAAAVAAYLIVLPVRPGSPR
jgi:hypothetical protein